MKDEAIPAATLVVMRDRPGAPPDLLMVTRPLGMAFAGGAMVFPGGRVDAADHALGADWGSDGAFRAAAIRETIEEAGIAVGLDPTPAPQAALSLQSALHDGGEIARLIPPDGFAPEVLIPFARWKPAFQHARRFDTIFYLARAPEGDWTPRPQEGECDSAEWLDAASVLSRIEAGTAKAIFPTVRNLERLAQFDSFEQARTNALARPLETITPWIEKIDGESWICIPKGLGYPVTRERMSSALRA